MRLIVTPFMYKGLYRHPDLRVNAQTCHGQVLDLDLGVGGGGVKLLSLQVMPTETYLCIYRGSYFDWGGILDRIIRSDV